MTTKISEIKRQTHTVDASGQVLGRLATNVATLLVGKNKSYFVRNLDCGDFVIVNNAQQIKITGNKMTKKIYTRYSGYPAGSKKTMMKDVATRNPKQILHHAVSGMLPNNKLKKFWLTRLTINM